MQIAARAYLIQGHGSRDLLAVGLGAPLPVVYDQVDGHLSLQAADVPVTEVITELVHLRGGRGKRHARAHTQNQATPQKPLSVGSDWNSLFCGFFCVSALFSSQ